MTRVVLTGLLPRLEYKMVVARAHRSVHPSASASSLLFVSRSRRSHPLVAPTRPPRQCLAAPPRRAWRTSRLGNRRTSPRRRRRCSSSRTCGRRGWTSARARSWCARAVRPSVHPFVRAPPSSSSSRSTPSVVPPARSLRPDDALSSAISPSSRPSQLKEACAEIPLPDALAHVKRVRKADDGDDRLRLVVCIASSSSSSSSFDDDRDVPDAARALVTRHALPPLERDAVPAHAPRTREQWGGGEREPSRAREEGPRLET